MELRGYVEQLKHGRSERSDWWMIILEGMAILSDREIPADVVGKYVSIQARAERVNRRTTVRLMSIQEV